MIILPAIDIINGSAVRLTQGDYTKKTVYNSSPLAVAQSFAALGAEHIHLVDLDGAADGSLSNFAVIKEIIEKTGLSAEVGGGIRSVERIEKYIEAGAGRVILGSAAVENFTLVEETVKKYGDRIAVGVDASDGFVAIHGWRTVTDIKASAFCLRLRDAGVKTVIYTDISKDGALSGTNLDAYIKLSQIENLNIIASGGITYYEELKALSDAKIFGAILGKAIYAGKIDLKKAIETVK